MPKAPDAPHDLSQHDSELRSILERRDALLKSLSGPVQQAQQALSRNRESLAPTTAAAEAKDLPAYTTEFEKRLAALETLDRELQAIRKDKSDPAGPAELNRLVAHQDSLTRLQQGPLSDEELARFAPDEYPELEELDGQIDGELREVRVLKRLLSSWWERVVVDFFRDVFTGSKKSEDLAAAEKELDKLKRKRRKVEEETRQVAAAALGKLVKQAAAAAQQKRDQLAANEAQLTAREVQATKKREEMAGKVRRAGDRLRRSLRAFCDTAAEQLNTITAAVTTHLASLPTPAVLPWDAPGWAVWPPADDKGKATLKPYFSRYIRLGEIREQIGDRLARVFDGEALRHLKASVQPVGIPVVVPFIGQNRTLIVSCDKRSRGDALELVHSFILRAAAMLGRQVKFTLLDPAGHGQAFPVQRFLQTRPSADDVNVELKGVEQDIGRINRNVLSGEAGLHELEERRLASEQFEVVVAAGFPERFDRRAVLTLYNLGSAGPRAGRYLILHHDTSEPLPKEHPIDGITNAFTLDPARPYTPPADFRFQADMVPSIQQQQALLERIKDAGKIDHSLAWDDIIRPEKPTDWWGGSSEMELSTPIGLRGGTDKAVFWLGQKTGGEVCAHGVLAGMTGSGKSTLYHDLILGLAARYSPDELRLYLIDLKQGVEFQPYKDLPHATVLSLNSPAELTLSILQEMESEMESRNQMFKAAGVGSFTDYRKLGKKLPRVLLLIDEYQRLFTDELADTASGVLLRLAQQGRSAGLHMFLGSQGFGAPGMLNQSAIFANFHLRVAMKLQPATVAGLTEFGPTGKRLIRDITMAGKFVLNDSGQDEKTIDGQAAFLKAERRDELIQQLRARAGAAAGRPEVFDGEAPTDAFDNHALKGVLGQRAALTPKALEALARKEEGAALGFGQPRWVAGDRPLGLWLGRRFNVHGHAMAMLVRNVQQNLVIVGSPAEARAGMLTGLFVSAAVMCRPTELAVDVLHAGGDDDDPSLLACTTVFDRLLRKVGHPLTFAREVGKVEALLSAYDAELATRKENGARDAPSRLLVLIEPDRMPAMRRAGDLGSKQSPHQERFRRLLAEGSQNGLHVVLVVSAFSLVNLVVDKRKDLPSFAHRAGLQMSQNDSFDLFGSYKATALQAEGAKVPVALYLNTETNDAVRFKPYAIPDPVPVERHARALAQAFATPASGG